MTTVLVSGVGAVTGYGVVRTLRQTLPEVRIVGADIHPYAVGAHWCDEFVVAPLSMAAHYPEWLAETTRRLRVDLVLPTIDADLDRHLACPQLATQLATQLECTVGLNSAQALRVSRDKWELDAVLRGSGDRARVPSSQSTDFAALSAELGIPFLVKARHGQGGRGMALVHDAADFARHAGRIPQQAFAQRHVGEDSEEYTVGVFGDGQGGLAAHITMRRRLAPDGMTARAEVLPTPASLVEVVQRLARLLSFSGPTNVQLRREGEHWHLLEINARISSSTSLRALFGYPEAAMAVDWFLAGELPDQPAVRPGRAARYVEDVVLDDRARL